VRRASLPAGPAAARLVAALAVPRSQQAVIMHKVARKFSIDQREVLAADSSSTVPLTSAASKFPKPFVVLLKTVFDEYDIDGSGSIDKAELCQALQKRKKLGRTSRERQAAETARENHYNEFDEAIKEALDKDGAKEVEFAQLLAVIFPQATNLELETMKRWVNIQDKPEGVDPVDPALRQEISKLFAMYDLDQSKDLSLFELQKAYGSFMRRDEVASLFKDADTDGNGVIDLEEFTQMILAASMCEIPERDLYI